MALRCQKMMSGGPLRRGKSAFLSLTRCARRGIHATQDVELARWVKMSGTAQALLSASAIGLAFAQAPAPVLAAEIECTRWVKVEDEDRYPPIAYLNALNKGIPAEPTCEWARLTGFIEPGDFEKVRSFLAQHYLWLNFINLRSPGGHAAEAIKIGNLLRRYLVTVHAPGRYENSKGALRQTNPWDPCDGPTCICASSCALIWFGAVERFGTVGIHRPRRSDMEFAALPPDQAGLIYKRILDIVSRYLEDMEAPRSIIENMIETSSADVFWIDGAERNLLHPPSFSEWVDASCGSFSKEEERELFRKRQSEEQQIQSKKLSDKFSKRIWCQRRLVEAQLRKLPPP